ncbi:MAG: hypothetical protein KGI91_06825 [Burkholderiales bacterium]|nr:hypothetical protein [Burkholderiales bacterium]MDE2076774.1 hypothetical protein [Burkholderiales bacterium]MDE2433867.1 hypothetical protein [Burkholderiales bacterium]HET8695065.1 hypothetical protein [Aquabacterium sp.]
MRALLSSPLALLALTISPASHAATGTLDQYTLDLGSGAQILAGLATLALLYVVKSRPPRMVKLDAEGRRYDPHVRGLFDD